MRRAVYPWIFVSFLAGCSIFNPGEKKSSNHCPHVESIMDNANLKYPVKGKLQVFTLSDSFSMLSVGNKWTYENTDWNCDENGDCSSSCGTMDFQIVSNDGNTAIIQTNSTLYNPFLATVRITNDSITLISNQEHYGGNLFPLFLGFRKNIFPCFKFDDGSGYAYGYDS